MIQGNDMKKIASSEAKNKFGELLDNTQREPVTIEKNGRPVAVMYSFQEHKRLEKMKLEILQRDLQLGIDQLDAGKGIPSDRVFAELLEEPGKEK